MRKRNLAAAALAAAVICGVFTGCGGKDIGRDAALEAALNDAGVSESDATRLKVSEDRDDGRKVYEIQFDADGKEYDYEIQASDGAIVSSDIEMIENYAELQNDSAQNSGTGQGGTEQSGNSGQDSAQGQTGTQSQAGNQGNTNSGSAPGVALNADEAIQIALNRVPGATAQDVRIELDRDDGRYKYEGEIIYNNIEYDFEIDANTGTILEWSEERY